MQRQHPKGSGGAGAADVNEWRGRALSRMGQAAFAVHGDASAYAVVCALQSGGAASTLTANLASARYVAETGDSGDAASNWVSAGAIANYPVTSLSGQDFTDAADAHAAADAAGKTTLINAFVRGGTWATHKTWITDFGAVFEAAGLEFYQYECSWQSGDWADGTTNEQAFKQASVYAPDLVYLYMDLWRHFREAGGVGPAVFCTSGTTQWAVRPNVYSNTPTKMWELMEKERLKERRWRMILT